MVALSLAHTNPHNPMVVHKHQALPSQVGGQWIVIRVLIGKGEMSSGTSASLLLPGIGDPVVSWLCHEPKAGNSGWSTSGHT